MGLLDFHVDVCFHGSARSILWDRETGGEVHVPEVSFGIERLASDAVVVSDTESDPTISGRGLSPDSRYVSDPVVSKEELINVVAEAELLCMHVSGDEGMVGCRGVRGVTAPSLHLESNVLPIDT